ncbi:G-type lectin S-receptor-like serine/threonine-protein kinase LECRK3 [Henckelia pumila]|uniref:G-type lectin S-receptor-like serine/threonine-protein kinase LECRK3 n=1 Tax=Henckelia pumila TaxID=405737 RepID=UPI003C6E101A
MNNIWCFLLLRRVLHYISFLAQLSTCAVHFCKMLHLMLVVLVPILATAQPYRNVSLGSSLTSDNSNSAWLSPSGDFAFGFRQMVPSGGYLLAIWFDKIPEKTIIWSANRDNPAAKGSKIQIFPDGRFELDDPTGQQIWSAALARSGVAYGAMLDTGNFVLVGNASAVLWQSFDYPTDTILPSQIFNQGSSLVSSFSDTNYSSGKFMFSMQSNGNLGSYNRNFLMDDNIGPYWVSNTVGSGFHVIFNQSGYIFLTAENGTILNFLSSNGASTSQYYQRAILDYDGVLRHSVYPKFGNKTGGRPMNWSVSDFLPENICLSMPVYSGWGACGFNSICSLLGIDQRPSCFCPTGYSLIDPSDKMSGCKPDFTAQSCDQESEDKSLFTFVDMPNTNFYGFDYITYQQVREDWCRQSCLDDCFCAAASYDRNTCWKKKYPLSNGRLDSGIGGKALIKVRKGNATLAPPSNNNSKKSDRSTLIITGSVLFGSSVLVNVILLIALLSFGFHLKRRESMILHPDSALPDVANVRSFTFKELQEATNGFKEELGSGACSTVYKGTLEDRNGPLIAVKKLNKIAIEAEQEFKAEVNSISRTNHKNLVQLLGYCDEGENRLLVYQYMSNGSIASFLFQNSRPNWYQRVQIAFGTARGLCYLHEECSTQIIHCDVKPQNVLLDGSLVAKISDFGLAKLLRDDQTRTMTGIRGTRGYVAPEWFRNMPITVKVDVYSFGILLLELICCRRNVEKGVAEEILSDWAYDCYKDGTLHLLVANDEETMKDIKRFKKFVMVAIWCIQEDPSLRPNMKRVLHMLEGSIEVPLPPDPESFID